MSGGAGLTGATAGGGAAVTRLGAVRGPVAQAASAMIATAAAGRSRTRVLNLMSQDCAVVEIKVQLGLLERTSRAYVQYSTISCGDFASPSISAPFGS